MKPLLSTLLDGLRVVLLRSPRGGAIDAGPGVFIALIAVYLLVALGIAAFDAAGPVALDPAGIPTVLTDALLTLLAAWLLVRMAGREVVWGAAGILLAATIMTALVVHWPLDHIIGALAAHDYAWIALLLDLLSRLWWFLVLLVFAHWLAPRGLGRVVAAAVLAYAVSAAAWWWLPASSLLTTAALQTDEETDSGGDIAQTLAQNSTTPDTGTGTPADPSSSEQADEADFDAEKLMYEQPALLDAALAKLTPHTPGKADLYVVAFAGDAGEDVFRNEAEYAESLFSQRFDAAGHVLVLENNNATLATRPLATWTNLQRALDAIAKKMDPAEDILLVYLTTHGSHDHQLLVDLDPLPLNQIEPDDLADALKTTPRIRWKVLVVNACYSGGFVDALRDDSTMVIASAREDRTSFGCGADSDITYFGKAFLAEALNQTTSIREAFDVAKKSVDTWETADKEEHSEPQIATSRSIEAKLAAWQRTLKAGAPVPFVPASKSESSEESP
ncbi:MAG TPA: C13 family peptidase [Dokdonella sp.]